MYLWKVCRHAGSRVMLCLEVISSMQMQHCSVGPLPLPFCCGSMDISSGESPPRVRWPAADGSSVFRSGHQFAHTRTRTHAQKT